MRKVIFGVANSLDNYIARKDHAVDWLRWSDEAMTLMKDTWERIDTILMGRLNAQYGQRGQVSPTRSMQGPVGFIVK